jgi:hypothetical protein
MLKFDEDTYVLTAKLQKGPIKEVGYNGVPIEDVISFCKKKIEEWNERFPCHENILAIGGLNKALRWLEHRTKDRTERGVEGTNLV